MTLAPNPRPKTAAELAAELAARWQFLVDRDPPPDLLTLVRAHGAHSAIPPAAWAEFDAKMKAWKARRRVLEKWP
ncbi:MAG: hypothetical protein IT537_03070 [Hyphomicrobiales bacterium]|nr:hypothetical protein [Hyphomicrobiales bacterium]